MTKHWITVVAVTAGAIALIIFLIMQNQKDKKSVLQQMENDYPKPEEHNTEDEHMD
jgi:hypothetical protein